MSQQETESASLPTEPSQPCDSLGDFSILLYGREKIGKTSFAAQFPDTLFLMFEPGGKALNIYKREVKDWKNFAEYLTLLEKSKKFKTVVIDTADLCYKFCEDYMLRKMVIQHASDEEWGKGWAMISDEFAKQMARLLKLGRGVIFTSHAAEKTIKQRSGQEHDRVVPTMSKQARKVLEPMVDIWCYMNYTADGHRELILRGDEQIAAGHRLQDHFVGIDRIPMGRDAAAAYTNFVRAFNGEVASTSATPSKVAGRGFKVRRTE